MSASTTSQLSYRVVEPLRPDHQAGLWVAKWLGLACAIQAVIVLANLMREVWDRGTRRMIFANFWGRPSSNPMWWASTDLLAQAAVCVGACVVILCGFGLAWRGRFYRKPVVAALLVFIVSLVAQACVRALGVTMQNRAWYPASLMIDAREWTSLGLTVLTDLTAVLLPVVGTVAFTRPWLREALESAEPANSDRTLRTLVIMTACVSALGVLFHIVAFTEPSRLDGFQDILRYRTPESMTGYWVLAVQCILPTCVVCQLAGALLVMMRVPIGRSLIVWAAKIAVIANIVTVFFAIAGTAIFNSVTGTSLDGLPITIVMRFMSLAIDLALWMYFGSSYTKAMLEAPDALAG
jgi:hypothetical protein